MNLIDTDVKRHKSNDVTSGAIHAIGVLLSIAVLVVLIVLGVQKGNVWHIVGYSFYGAGLIMLYFSSALYHFLPESMGHLKHFARRFDHAMIYVLIAATYTPITFIVFSDGWRWSLFGVIWGLAIIGVVIKLLWLPIPPALSITLYAMMGWLIIIAFSPLIKNIGVVSFVFLVLGGLSYTIGILFFALEKKFKPRKYFWMHEIFHVCVLGGSVLHTIVMFRII